MKKRKFVVEVTRVDTKSKDFEVEAGSVDEAKAKAVEMAANYEWGRGEAEYVTSIMSKGGK